MPIDPGTPTAEQVSGDTSRQRLVSDPLSNQEKPHRDVANQIATRLYKEIEMGLGLIQGEGAQHLRRLQHRLREIRSGAQHPAHAREATKEVLGEIVKITEFARSQVLQNPTLTPMQKQAIIQETEEARQSTLKLADTYNGLASTPPWQIPPPWDLEQALNEMTHNALKQIEDLL